jgi:hypothetical protein
MRRLCLIVAVLCIFTACSPRDFLTRRLAAALIAGSDTFTVPQQFPLRTGPVSNRDFSSPQYLVLQHRGWIIGSATACPADVTPPPCFEVTFTPLGVDTFRDLIRGSETGKQIFNIPTARRELVSITGISKEGNLADVEFIWRWAPQNEVGSALNVGGLQYRSSVAVKHYDDGWRLVAGSAPRSGQSLDDALKNADPVP